LAKQPKILVASWLKWASAARFAGALVSAGADVEVVCPSGHPLLTVSGIRSRRYRSTARISSLRQAIEAGPADFVIACDDFAVHDLLRLHRQASAEGPQGARLVKIIEGSIGSVQALRTILSRTELMAFAQTAGISTPQTAPLTSKEDLDSWLLANGAPAFIKIDGTWGGAGVRAIADQAQARSTYDLIVTPPGWFTLAKRALRFHVLSQARARLAGAKPAVTIQRAVPGVDATCSIACWRGELLAFVSGEVLQTARPFGIATHVRMVEGRAMRDAAEILAQRLGLSGIFGLDFIIDQAAGSAWLIEMNARPTQVSHLPWGGEDLASALVKALGGNPPEGRSASACRSTVALFPHQFAWRRRPAPIAGAWDDVPLDQPGLVAAYKPPPEWVRQAALALRGVLPKSR
jgi:hypothetical protein